MLDIVKMGMKNFEIEGLQHHAIKLDQLEVNYKKVLYEVMSVNLVFARAKLLNSYVNDTDYRVLFDRILEIIYYTAQGVKSVLRVKDVMNPSCDNKTSSFGQFRFTAIDYSKNTPYQNLLLYILGKLSEDGYCKYREYCYKPVYTAEGHYTYAWSE